MSESPLETTDLKAQYTTQVTADLERNAKEQKRLDAEITVLREQLETLRHDQALLVSMQQALGGEDAAAAREAKAADTAAVPVPRQASAAPRAGARKKAAGKSKKTANTSGTKTPKAATLGERIRDYLGPQTEPRSAAEVTAALAETHPERNANNKVVRMALEGLVAKGHVYRTKRGRPVFYSAADTTQDADQAAPSEPAEATAAGSVQKTSV